MTTNPRENQASLQQAGEVKVNTNRHLNASYKIISILRQSKTSIERIIDELPDIFGIFDQDGNIVKGNFSLSTLLQTDFDGLLDKNISHLFSTNSWWLFKQNIQLLSQVGVGSSQNGLEFELPVENLPGEKKIFIWKVKRISTGKANTLPLFFVLGTDVTILRDREDKLRNLTEKLQELVNEKTKDITTLLDSIEEGIFSVNSDLTLNDAHSKEAESIFRTTEFGSTTFGELLHLDAARVQEFRNWLDLVSSPRGLKRWTKYQQICPVSRLVLKDERDRERIIRFEYLPILRDTQFRQLLVLATDITELVHNEEKIREAERVHSVQTERILALVKNISVSVAIFFEETDRYLAEVASVTDLEDLTRRAQVLFSSLHTLKGNAGSFGFHSLSAFANAMEDVVEAILHNRMAEIDDIWERWTTNRINILREYKELKEIKQMLFSDSADHIQLNRAVYQDLISKVQTMKGPEAEQVRAIVEELDTHRFVDLCQKYDNVIKLYREQNHKEILDLKIDTPNVFVQRSVMAIFDPALIHIVRNAVDHGIESDDERRLLNKGPGVINMGFHKDAKGTHVYVTDNGGGIDPEKIAEAAVRRDMVTADQIARMSADEKLQMIFRQGMTTKTEVTSISGRGTGLDAVRSALSKYSGSVEIDSQIGKGTTFKLFLPNLP